MISGISRLATADISRYPGGVREDETARLGGDF
jgi:hypothetical protein